MWVVTGASGFVGSAALAHLTANGIEAVGLSRSRGSHRLIDRYVRERLREALAGATGVIHAAAVVHQPHGNAEMHKFTVESARELVAAARDVGVRKIVLLSSIKVYGETPVGRIDEETPVAPEGAYATAKLEAESVVREATDMAPIILRLCPVYGRGDKGNVRTMIRAIRRRVFFVPGDGGTRKSIVHISTVTAAIAAAVASQNAGTYVVADAKAPSIRELADTIARALGRRPPPAMPLVVLRTGARVLGVASKVAGRPTSLSAAQITKATTPTVCDSTRLSRELGVDCHVDLDATIRDEVEWLRGIHAL